VALKIKPQLRQLDSGIYETVWPGDSSVDLESSDLFVWMIEGEKKGLEFRSKSKKDQPDAIRMKPLGDRAISEIAPLIHAGSVNQFNEAFRFGIRKVPGIELGWTTINNVKCIDDATLDYLLEEDKLLMDLPVNLVMKKVFEVQGLDVIWNEVKDKELVPTPMVMALGAQALVRSFRRRKRNK
jgi:hypothetical protein